MILHEWKGHRIKVIYNDDGRPTPKHGVLVDADEQFVSLETDRGLEAFRVENIIRLERSEDNDKKD